MTQFGSDSTGKHSAIDVKSFYGNKVKISFNDTSFKGDITKKTKLPYRLNNLLGPTQIWKVFHKQNDALEYAKSKRSGLMTFAFQQWDGTRAFLVAHPKIFWHYDVQKDPAQRCTYEIIPESCACKLYFDLEFEIEFNQAKKGGIIVDTFISVVLHFINVLLNVKVSRNDILHLDSSTDVKFSRHLIFVLSSLVFCDNKSVGEFVCFICQKIQLYLSSICNTPGNSDDANNYCKCCRLPGPINSGCIKDIGLSNENLKHLIVLNRKGKEQLICDCGVYSRNRHFRLFQNTKWRKNAPLLLSDDNTYTPSFKPQEKVTDVLFAEAVFLDSLISNIEFHQKNVSDIKIIYFKNYLLQAETSCATEVTNLTDLSSYKLNEISPYPEIDKFINSLVVPGHVRRSVYFSSSSVIVYDIFGYRYCQNIGRQHRSNNVKYIVNLNDYTYYQKCYDPDCSEFRSVPVILPLEVKLKLEENSFETVECGNISDSELVEVVNVIEDLLNNETNC